MVYASAALEMVEAFSREHIDELEERKMWIARLSTYDRWRLLELDKFTGRLSQVWAYLEGLVPPAPRASEVCPALPAPDSNVYADWRDHYRQMTSVVSGVPYTLADHERQWEAELKGLEVLKEKYPRSNFARSIRTRKEQMEKKREWLRMAGR